jgi:flagellar basal body-associated protein FliL
MATLKSDNGKLKIAALILGAVAVIAVGILIWLHNQHPESAPQEEQPKPAQGTEQVPVPSNNEVEYTDAQKLKLIEETDKFEVRLTKALKAVGYLRKSGSITANEELDLSTAISRDEAVNSMLLKLLNPSSTDTKQHIVEKATELWVSANVKNNPKTTLSGIRDPIVRGNLMMTFANIQLHSALIFKAAGGKDSALQSYQEQD